LSLDLWFYFVIIKSSFDAHASKAFYQTDEGGNAIMLKEKIETALNKVRPSLQADGGDVQLVDVDEKGVVKVKLTGACGGCPMSQMTLKMGIEKVLRQQVPEVTRVESV
jgi:Fe-S cluster biogenesis protein NfuA